VTGPKVASCVTGTAPKVASCVIGTNIDPNTDYPAPCLGLGATIITNKRKIEADDFVKGLFEIALEPDEIITTVTGPKVALCVTGANSDPTAGSPAACLALGATIITNNRQIEADDFVKGLFETALGPIITTVTGPKVALCVTAAGPKVAFYVTSHAYAPCGGSDLCGRAGDPFLWTPFPCGVPNPKPSASWL